MKKIGFLGAGNMAKAIAQSLIGSKEICAYDINEDRCNIFAEMGVQVCISAKDLIQSSDILILAVKPQVMHEVLSDISEYISNNMLIVSIAAGVTVSKIASILGSDKSIVRVMPNTPVMQGCGAVGVFGGSEVTSEQLDIVKSVFSTSSQVIVVEDESLIDAVTAVSGSGPAYFFYMVEAMVKAGVQEGLSDAEAKLLASATCMGAGAMLLNMPNTPAELRKMVTSPGGTTQAAIESLDLHNVADNIAKAVSAAAERSRQLRA